MNAAHQFKRQPNIPGSEGGASDAWAIVGLVNEATGVPMPIAVEGQVKCIICTGMAEDALVCESCAASVRLVRAAGNVDTLRALIDFASAPGMLQILEILTSEDVIADIMMKRIEDARNRD